MTKQKKTIALSLGLGLMVALLFYVYSTGLFSMVGSARSKAAEKPDTRMQQVVTAAVDIDLRTELKPEMLNIVEVPADYVHPEALLSLDSAIGRISKDRVAEGEVLLSRNLRDMNSPSELSFVIPDGMRAITVGASITSAVANMVRPGDYVDVVVYINENIAGENLSFTLLPGMMVLAIDTKVYGEKEPDGKVGKLEKSGEKAVEYKSVTIAATPEECVKLSLAESIGSLKLALYSPVEGTPGEPVVEIAEVKEMIAELRRMNVVVEAVPEPAPKKTWKPRPRGKVRTTVSIKKNETKPEVQVAVAPKPVEPVMLQIMRGLELETIEVLPEETERGDEQ